MTSRSDRFVPHLVCPATREKLERDADALVSVTGQRYEFRGDGKVDFTGLKKTDLGYQRDFTDRLKARAKDLLGGLYVLLVHVIAPVMPRLHWSTLETYWSWLVKQHSAGKELVVQVGSGNDRVAPNIINVDIFDFPEVDVIADCTRLPFPNDSVDGVISQAVLEHVPNPDAFLREAQRVLKPGGFIITGVPFMQPFHASPSDYYRWTHAGLAAFHENHGFSTERVLPTAGPTSGFLWVLQEWLAIVLSLGIGPLYYLWWILLTATLFPLKLLDVLFIHYPQAFRLNSFYLYVGRK